MFLLKHLNGIIDLYNKEKEKNLKLEDLTNVLNKKIHGLYDDNIQLLKEDENNKRLNYRYIECQKVEAEECKSESYIEEHYISKDKIRDLIAERKFELQQEFEDFDEDIVLKVLNELLEE